MADFRLQAGDFGVGGVHVALSGVERLAGGLGLPDRDYYLREDAEYVEFRRKYVEYLAKLFTLAGQPDGAMRAAKILELETSIARIQP